MDTRSGLLAAVSRTPADDTPRLVFADFLDDTGDPADAAWAEFVRLQVALAKEPPRKTEECSAEAPVHLRRHGARCYETVFTTRSHNGTPGYAVGDRVDVPFAMIGRKNKRFHGLRVGKVSGVTDGWTYSAVLYEDAGSVPDATGPLRKRLDELWGAWEPGVAVGPLRELLGDLWRPGNEDTSITADFCAPRPIHPDRCFYVGRGLFARVRVPALAELRADGWALTRRLAAVPGVSRVVPADRVPNDMYLYNDSTLLYSWDEEGTSPGVPGAPPTTDELPADLIAVVGADPRRVIAPGGPRVAEDLSFPDRATADDALARGVCNLARAKLGLPPTE